MVATAHSNFLVIHERVLRALGISLKIKEATWYNVYSFLFICLTLSLPLIAFHAVIQNDYPLDILLENMAYGIASINSCAKMFALFRVRKQVGKVFLLLKSDVFAPNFTRGGPNEENLMNECTFYVNGQTMLLYGSTILNVLLSVTASLMPTIVHDAPTAFPYVGFSVFDASYSPVFELVYLYQVFIIIIICLGTITVTTFMAGSMAYISYQFKILQNFIRNSAEYARKISDHKENESFNVKGLYKILWKYLKQTTKDIVEYHTAIMDLAEQFEQLFNIPTLVDFLGMSIVICTALFSASLFPKFNLHVINQLIVASGNIFLQFLTAYWGNEVIVASKELSTACVEVDFVGEDDKFQNNLLVIMQRSQKPVQFTVGKFAPLSLQTFVTVMRSAYSYLMILYNIKERIA